MPYPDIDRHVLVCSPLNSTALFYFSDSYYYLEYRLSRYFQYGKYLFTLVRTHLKNPPNVHTLYI